MNNLSELAVIASGLVPSLSILWWICARDHLPEAPHRIIAAFVMGILVSFLVVLLSSGIEPFMPVIQEPIWLAMFDAFALAAFPEELAKFCAVWFVCLRMGSPRHQDPMEGVIFAVAVSLGFACIENILYVLSAGEGWVRVAITRSIMTVPAHALLGVTMGFFLSEACRHKYTRLFWLAGALFFPILLHGLYNTPFIAAIYTANTPEYRLSNALRILPYIILPMMAIWSGMVLRYTQIRKKAYLAAKSEPPPA